MIVEAIMAQGSFEVPLKMTVPLSLWKKLEPFGHIVVFGQNLNPNEIGDQAALDAARYSGVLLGKDTSGEGVTLSGCGMTWWLGDDLDNGPMVENKVVLTGATLSDAISAVLPDSITVGTINNAGLGTFTGDFHWVTPLEAIREICLALGAEFRVNPNGTIDAGLKENVFVITNPEVVMVRRGFGTDHQYKSVPVTNMRSWLDAREYVTKVSAVIKEPDGTRTLVDSSTRDPNWVDIHGNEFSRSRVVPLQPGNPVTMATYTLSVLNASAMENNQEVSTEHYEISDGNFNVGDAFYAYDPPAFIDENNVVPFRGDFITPMIIRLIKSSWPLRSGMGVWYRSSLDPGEGAVEWIDLTNYIAWEGEGSEFV